MVSKNSLFESGRQVLSEDGVIPFLHKGTNFFTTRALWKWYDYKSTNIFSINWDVLLILDGCRVDALEFVSDEYSFLPTNPDSIVSTGPGSATWMANTFTHHYRTEINRCVYITANPHTRRVLGAEKGMYADLGGDENWIDELAEMIPVWEKAWDAEIGTVPPRPVTDNLLAAYHPEDNNRYIAHYMQPHFPSLADYLGSKMDIDADADWKNKVWDRLATGELSHDRVWSSYIENLRCVLDDVEIVLDNIDAEGVVISSDHGNSFGERGQYGHGNGGVKTIREVPWVVTTGSNNGSYEPTIGYDESTISIEEQLAALGYH